MAHLVQFNVQLYVAHLLGRFNNVTLRGDKRMYRFTNSNAKIFIQRSLSQKNLFCHHFEVWWVKIIKIYFSWNATMYPNHCPNNFDFTETAHSGITQINEIESIKLFCIYTKYMECSCFTFSPHITRYSGRVALFIPSELNVLCMMCLKYLVTQK